MQLGTTVEPWIKEIVDQARKTYGSVEVKTKNGSHYLYKATSIYKKDKKYPQKITKEYIGKITPQGLIPTKTKEKTIHEYANSQLLASLLDEITPQLHSCFPNNYQELYALAITKTIRNTPLKYTKDAWEKLYTSTKIKAALSKNTISQTLRSVGTNWQAQSTFFNSLIKENTIFYFDLSSVFSQSTNLTLAEKGYNKEHLHLDQINFALLFSEKQKTPVMLKTMPGSIRDVKTLQYVLKEFSLKNCIVVMDRGFFSKANVEAILSLGVSFVLPLKRNSKLADYALKPDRPFMYRDRGIAFADKLVDRGGAVLRLFLFEDAVLGGEEKSNLLKLQVKGKAVVVDERRLGRVSVLTDLLDWSGEQVYCLYKERESVECAFDALKNELENDKTYLGDSDAVRGYFFVSFLCLYLYFRVLEKIRSAGLTSELSVNELLFLLSKVYIVKRADGKEWLTEIPKKVETLIKKLDLKNLLPQNLGS
jgi:transposase